MLLELLQCGTGAARIGSFHGAIHGTPHRFEASSLKAMVWGPVASKLSLQMSRAGVLGQGVSKSCEFLMLVYTHFLIIKSPSTKGGQYYDKLSWSYNRV